MHEGAGSKLVSIWKLAVLHLTKTASFWGIFLAHLYLSLVFLVKQTHVGFSSSIGDHVMAACWARLAQDQCRQ